jgi:hypothetical protein
VRKREYEGVEMMVVMIVDIVETCVGKRVVVVVRVEIRCKFGVYVPLLSYFSPSFLSYYLPRWYAVKLTTKSTYGCVGGGWARVQCKKWRYLTLCVILRLCERNGGREMAVIVMGNMVEIGIAEHVEVCSR